MTTENLALVAIGMFLNAGVFAAGILVGCSLQTTRKGGTHDDSSSYEKEIEKWHGIHGHDK